MVKYIDETKKVIDKKSLLFYKCMIDYCAKLDSYPKTLDLKIIK